MQYLRYSISLGLVAFNLTALTACTQSTSEPTTSGSIPPATSASASPTPQTTSSAPLAEVSKPSPKPTDNTNTSGTLATGTYCYGLKSETLTAQAKVNIAAGNQVSGIFNGTVHNKDAGYFTSYTRNFQGPLTGSQAKLDIQTKIEYDNQTAQENWTIAADNLKTDRETLQKIDCAQFKEIAVKNPDKADNQPSGMSAGTYCYGLKSTTLTATAKATVDSGNQVSGVFNGTVHNKEAGYFTSYTKNFQGSLTGSQAKLDIQTKIEGDNQTAKETWTITTDSLKTTRETLQKAAC